MVYLDINVREQPHQRRHQEVHIIRYNVVDGGGGCGACLLRDVSKMYPSFSHGSFSFYDFIYMPHTNALNHHINSKNSGYIYYMCMYAWDRYVQVLPEQQKKKKINRSRKCTNL